MRRAERSPSGARHAFTGPRRTPGLLAARCSAACPSLRSRARLRLSETRTGAMTPLWSEATPRVGLDRRRVFAHPRCRSGLSEGIGKALDVTIGLLIQAPDGP